VFCFVTCGPIKLIQNSKSLLDKRLTNVRKTSDKQCFPKRLLGVDAALDTSKLLCMHIIIILSLNNIEVLICM
jgi:hypothetical protein